MHDEFELMDLMVYMLALCLVLPFAQALKPLSEGLSLALAICAAAPLPVYIVNLRWPIPGWIEKLLHYHCAALWLVAIAGLIASAITWLAGW